MTLAGQEGPDQQPAEVDFSGQWAGQCLGWVPYLGLPLPCWVILAKSPPLTVPQFPFLQYGDNDPSFSELRGDLWMGARDRPNSGSGQASPLAPSPDLLLQRLLQWVQGSAVMNPKGSLP